MNPKQTFGETDPFLSLGNLMWGSLFYFHHSKCVPKCSKQNALLHGGESLLIGNRGSKQCVK